MALWACRDCTAAYAVGLPACPQCGSGNYEEDGMAKITVHGGASNRDVPDAEVVRPGPGRAEPVAEPHADPEATDYDAMTYKELQGELKRRDLPRGGNAAELAERLRADDAGDSEGGEPA